MNLFSTDYNENGFLISQYVEIRRKYRRNGKNSHPHWLNHATRPSSTNEDASLFPFRLD